MTTHLLQGTVLSGRYQIIQELRSGSAGVTYLAYDQTFQIRVAIKEYLPAEHTTRTPGQSGVLVLPAEHTALFYEGKNKFLEESRRLARFQNEPGIVRIFNVFEENNTAYMVMEYLEGEPLESYLKRYGVLEENFALKLLQPVIESLKTVHAEGIIHRDISPENIFLTTDGSAKLIGFSASRYAAGSASLTVVVKPGFSPEESYRSLGDQGTYTDVYGLAAVLYRMLTGQNPPDAMDRRTSFEQKKRDCLAEPHTLNRNISQVRENAILNALNVRIEDRTPDITTFQNELMAEKPAKRRGTGILKTRLYNLPLWLKIAVPAVLLTAVVLIMLLTSGAIGFSRFSGKEKQPAGTVKVPDVEGMTTEDGIQKLKKSSLLPRSNGTAESEYVKAGLIVYQTPTAGTYLYPKGAVDLTVSCGKGVVEPVNGVATVPYVAWDSEEAAVQKLKKAGLGEPQIERKYDSVVAEGAVISQDIGYDEKVPEGSVVKLEVSLGVDPIELSEETLTSEITGSMTSNQISPAEGTKIRDTGDSGSEITEKESPEERDVSEEEHSKEPASEDEEFIPTLRGEGVKILYVKPYQIPEGGEETTVRIRIEYNLESSKSGKIYAYAMNAEGKYNNFYIASIENGRGFVETKRRGLSLDELSFLTYAVMLFDEEMNTVDDDVFHFFLQDYIENRTFGDGQDYYSVDIDGNTCTMSLTYDKLKDSYPVNYIGSGAEYEFRISFTDGKNDYEVSTRYYSKDSTSEEISLEEMWTDVSMLDEGTLEWVRNADLFVSGTTISWKFELPPGFDADSLLVTAWAVYTHEENLDWGYDSIKGVRHFKDEWEKPE